MAPELPILNGDTATFECTFGRGCDGLCCRNGRPSIDPQERQQLDENLHKIIPELRPAARAVLQKSGYLSQRQKYGHPMLRVVQEWCIFFNQGCVLHKLGAQEGDAYRYKPHQCALFPLARDEQDRWYVRQHGYQDEAWDLFCLSPGNSSIPVSESLAAEIQLARKFTEAE